MFYYTIIQANDLIIEELKQNSSNSLPTYVNLSLLGILSGILSAFIISISNEKLNKEKELEEKNYTTLFTLNSEYDNF